MTVQSALGLQLDASTLALYKRTRETGAGGVVATSPVADEEGNYPLETVDRPGMTWNVQGNAAPTRYARTFTRNLAGFETLLRSVSTVDLAYRDASIAEHTIHILFRIDDPDHDTVAQDMILFAVHGASSEAVEHDFLTRIRLLDGQLEHLHEISGPNHIAKTDNAVHGLGTNLFTAGAWHVVTLKSEDRSGDNTKYTKTFYLGGGAHPNGTLIQTFDTDAKWTASDVGDGTKPTNASGSSAFIAFGHFQTQNAGFGLWGSVGYGVFVEEAQSDQQIADVHAELIAIGDLITNLPSSPMRFRYRFNEEPGMIDESDHGLHIHGSPTTIVDHEAADCAILDIIGSGNRPMPMAGITCRLNQYINSAGFKLTHGRTLREFFTDDVDVVPAYTLQMWAVQFDPTVVRYPWQWDDSGESLETNYLFRYGINTSLESDFLAERTGLATNITQSPANTKVLNTGGDAFNRYGRILLTIRADENPSQAGEMRVRWSVNDNIDVASHILSGVPNGGSGGYGVKLGPWDGLISECKISKIAITDQQILDDFANCGSAGTPSAPSVPQATPLSLGQGGIPFLPDPSGGA